MRTLPPSTSRQPVLTAVLTCHNRRATTLECLDALERQRLPEGMGLRIVLVDDGSTDGTAEAVRDRHPNATVIEGDGSLFWAGGMRVGFDAAREQGSDYYLWINDDTRIQTGALRHLFETLRAVDAGGERAIVVGTTVDPDTGQPTYGGRVRCSEWHPLKYALVEPEDRPVRCDVMNANCVLIPDPVASEVGGVDAAYTHAMADYDYALRAAHHGIGVWVAPDPVGTCARNETAGTWEDPTLSLAERWRRMQGPKGLPLREWATFARRHVGPLGPLYALLPVGRLLITSLSPQLQHSA